LLSPLLDGSVVTLGASANTCTFQIVARAADAKKAPGGGINADVKIDVH
jgi:hypothetical protein